MQATSYISYIGLYSTHFGNVLFFSVHDLEHNKQLESFGHKQKQNAQFIKSLTKYIFEIYLTQMVSFYSMIPMIGHNFL